jgi:hypothetical protein
MISVLEKWNDAEPAKRIHLNVGYLVFGFPSYFAGKKLCICLYEEGVAIKLPEQSVAELLKTDSNTVPFQPMGKAKMREWVQINLSCSEDYQRYKSVFEESIRYVLGQQTPS